MRLRARRRRGPARRSTSASAFDPLIGRSVRAAPVAAASAAARAVRGARVGDLRAADRVRAGGGDPAPADRRGSGAALRRGSGAARPADARRCWPGRRRRCSSPSTSSAGRALALRAGRARGGERHASTCTTPRPRARLAAAARDPRGSAAGRSRCSRCTARAGSTSCRPATSALREARRAAASGGDPRARASEEEVARVLRAVRAVGRARRAARAAGGRQLGGHPRGRLTRAADAWRSIVRSRRNISSCGHSANRRATSG